MCEKWGRHVLGKGVLGILLKKRIKFLTYGRNGVATYGEKGVLGILLKKRIKFLTYGRNGVATYGEKGVLGI